MIGRFSDLGSYKELFNLHDLLRIVLGGTLTEGDPRVDDIVSAKGFDTE